MRRAVVPIQLPPTIHLDLFERLEGTAARLAAMPAEAASSLSITAGWQGRADADVRSRATAIASPLGFAVGVEAVDDAVTVTFRRPARPRR